MVGGKWWGVVWKISIPGACEAQGLTRGERGEGEEREIKWPPRRLAVSFYHHHSVIANKYLHITFEYTNIILYSPLSKTHFQETAVMKASARTCTHKMG